ncbi:c-type cytochrome [Tsuneonella rigui]|jgi:cytochrome c|uniref:c-type cytochrome n=1 Tax=Tsuneonella rigui TaxID=1708790 RepID=UPI000F7F8B6E|nr:c-type cytochrome [Tsuneonella rigui]
MQDRFNTAAGWVLFSGIVALGLSSVSAKYFQADKPHRPHEMGYPIEGVVEEGEGGADAGPSLAVRLASGDVAAGEKAAQGRCGTCHTFDQGGGVKQGPNLWATVGEPIGKGKAGFAFSSALSGHGGDWSYENLDAWLASPKAFAPGTKMSFAGLSNGQDRANIILYLKQQGGGPALPTPEAAAPAAEGADKAAAGDQTATAGPAEKPGADAAGAVAMPAGDQPANSNKGDH